MSQITQKFNRFSVFLIVACAFYGFNLVYTFQDSRFHLHSLWLVLGIGVVVTGFLAFLVVPLLTKVNRRYFFLGLAIVAFGLRFGWIIWVATPPISDFLDMHNAASSAAGGNFAFIHSDYFVRWNYQLGFTLYEALIIKLFGSSLFVLKLFNVLFSVGTAFAIYGIARQLFGEVSGRIAALLYALYLPPILMCTVLTNQHLSTFLFTLGVYYAVRIGPLRLRMLGVGLCFGLGHLIRPLGSFYLTVFLAYIVFLFFSPSFRDKRKALLKHTAGAVLVFLVLQQLFSYSLVATGVTNGPLASREPYWKFMVGLNQATNGGWSPEDDTYAITYPLGAARNEAEWSKIKERLENKDQVTSLLARKFKIMWGTNDAAPFWSLVGTEQLNLQTLLRQIERMSYLLLSALGCIALVTLLVAKPTRVKEGLILVLFLVGGYAVFHLVIEVQTRYRLDIIPLFLIVAGYGAVVIGRGGNSPKD
ncbi:MAG: glycosyltransferase family 39 protein [Gorillibacterium sp.]|nr:glycosyltransferase family 39 protein [Gorillibacterium sp.]